MVNKNLPLTKMNIFSSKNELSNNYRIDLEIEGQKWKNVSHYIYSNLLHNESNKRILKNNLTKISKNFHELSEKENEILIVDALSTALPIKFSNVELARKLIATGDKQIVYKSSNKVLGIDDNGQGNNVYGKILMRIRKTLKNKLDLDYKVSNINVNKELIYRSYLVKYFLEDYMYNNMSIERFSNMNVDSIYALISGNYNSNSNVPFNIYNKFQLYKNSIEKLPKDVVLGFVDPELKSNPNRVVDFVLKTKLRNMKIMLEERKKNIIYDMYLDDFLEKKGMNNDIVKNAFESYNQLIHNKEQFKKYLETAYDSQSLPKNLQSSIYNILKDIRIPTEKQVVKAESVIFELDETSSVPKQSVVQEQKEKSGTDSFLDSLFTEKQKTTKKQADNESEGEGEGEGDEKKETETIRQYKRSKIRYGGRKESELPPLKPKINPTLQEDVRGILDAMMEGRDIPEDMLNRKYPEEVQEIIFITSNEHDLYFDLSPIARQIMFIKPSSKQDDKSKMVFPSVSHYLMFCMIKNLIGNVNDSYDMIIMPNPDPSSRKINFAPLEVINHRYIDALVKRYDYLLQKAVNVKLKNSEIVQALANTGKAKLYYNDVDNEIIGTGPNKTGSNLTGVYLMHVRSEMDIPSVISRDLSPLEIFVQNEDEWVENRVKDYCNAILNTSKSNESAIKIVDVLYPCNLPVINNIDVPVYFDKIVREEIPILKQPVIKHFWSKILSICNYVLQNSKDPKGMLEKASLIIQSEDYSRNKKKDKAIETAILNIANKIKIDNQLTNKDVYLATNILLKEIDIFEGDSEFEDGGSDDEKSSQGSVDYGTDEEVEGDGEDRVEDDESPGDNLYGDSPMRNPDDNKREHDNEPLSKDILKFNINRVIQNTNIPQNILNGRINYFQSI